MSIKDMRMNMKSDMTPIQKTHTTRNSAMQSAIGARRRSKAIKKPLNPEPDLMVADGRPTPNVADDGADNG